MANFSLHKISELKNTHIFTIYVLKSIDDLVSPLRNEKIKEAFQKKVTLDKTLVILDESNIGFVLPSKKALEHYKSKEYFRKKGHEVFQYLKTDKIDSVAVYGADEEAIYDFAEGLALSTYTFDKYKSKPSPSLQVKIYLDQLSSGKINKLSHLLEAVSICKNWVNEPVIHLTAEQFSIEIKENCENLPHTKVEIFNKSKIESLKMGGLLGINKGAPNPPTFTIIDYKHPKAKNSKPIALVGKGVVFDTGGLSLKETAGSMDIMKCDMAGAAAVVATVIALAKNEIPVHIMAFVPATENRPDGNAIVPSDIITMYNGTTVEVLNTDAEGRVILGDALSYAEKFDPELIIDLATLTGAAIAAIGKEASVLVGNADTKTKNKLTQAAFEVYERIVELPLWEEYEKEIESDIADIKNIGSGSGAGTITAAAFLKHFTTKPWMHLDIAGPAFIKSQDNYRSKNATAYGVRLLYEFITKY